MGEGIDTFGAPPAEGIGTAAARGGAVVFASMALQKVIALGVMVTLVRLLAPEDYGLVGMVFALTAFVHVFSDLGLTLATVQKRDLTEAQLSTLFWLNLSFSVLLTGVAAAMAPAIGWFYGEPRLVPLGLLSAAGFALAGLGMQHTALMMRRMQFGRLAARDLAGLLAGGATGIAMALRGWGAYALAGQMLAGALTRSLASWAMAGWAPGLPVRGSGVRGALRFGGYLTGFNVLNYFARNMDKVLLGRFWGPVSVGFYTRAYTLMTYPITLVSGPMGQVMIPALSRLKEDRERYAAAHLRAMRILALISFPMAGGLAVMAEEAILIVFGPRWVESVPIFRVLCVAGMFQAWGNSVGWLYVSAGKAKRMFHWAAFACPLIVLAMLPGVWHGPVGLAAGRTAVAAGLLPFGFVFAARSAGVRALPLLRVATGPLAATGVMVGAVLAVRYLPPARWDIHARALVQAGTGVVVFTLAALVFARRAVQEGMSALAHLLPGAARPANVGR